MYMALPIINTCFFLEFNSKKLLVLKINEKVLNSEIYRMFLWQKDLPIYPKIEGILISQLMTPLK